MAIQDTIALDVIVRTISVNIRCHSKDDFCTPVVVRNPIAFAIATRDQIGLAVAIQDTIALDVIVRTISVNISIFKQAFER